MECARLSLRVLGGSTFDIIRERALLSLRICTDTVCTRGIRRGHSPDHGMHTLRVTCAAKIVLTKASRRLVLVFRCSDRPHKFSNGHELAEIVSAKHIY